MRLWVVLVVHGHILVCLHAREHVLRRKLLLRIELSLLLRIELPLLLRIELSLLLQRLLLLVHQGRVDELLHEAALGQIGSEVDGRLRSVLHLDLAHLDHLRGVGALANQLVVLDDLVR